MKYRSLIGLGIVLSICSASVAQEKGLRLDVPVDGAKNVSFFPDLLWQESTQKESAVGPIYQVQMASDEAFQSIVADEQMEIARYVPREPLEQGETYYWRVRKLAEDSVWSAVGSFTVARYTNCVINITALDSVAQVRAAFQKAKANAPATVRLAEDVCWGTDDVDLFNLQGLNNVWFDGNGKTITVTNPANRVFHLFNSGNVIFSDFSIDFSLMPYVMLEVVDRDLRNNLITVRTVSNAANPCLELNDSRMLAADRTHMRLLDKEHLPRVKFNEDTYIHQEKNKYIDSWTENGTLYHHIGFPKPEECSVADFEVGDIALRTARWDSRNILRAYKCRHVAFNNVTVYASASQFVSSIDGSGLIVLGCRVAQTKGRASPLTADVVYVRRNEIGPWIQGCSFVGNGDDCINLHSIGAPVRSGLDDRTVVMGDMLHLSRFDVGDQVAVWDPSPGDESPVYTTVAAVDLKSKTVQFADPITPLHLGDLGWFRNTLVFNITKNNRRFYICDNEIRDNARFGILLGSQDGAVVGNLLDHCGSSAVQVGNDTGEGLNAINILFKNNRFVDCGYIGNYFNPRRAVVQIDAYGVHWKEVPVTLHRNLRFVDNRIEGWDSGAVKIRNCSDVLFSNTLISAGTSEGFADPAGSNDVFTIEFADQITVIGTSLQDERPRDHYLVQAVTVSNVSVDAESQAVKKGRNSRSL